ALAPMIAKVKREALKLRIVGLIDSSGLVFDADGFSPRRLAALAAAKAKGTPLAKATGGRRTSAAEAVAFVARHALTNPILVDVTADETTETLTAALGAGMHVVLANKRPVTTDKRQYDAVRAAAQAHGGRLLLEATVGAGLPIIDTYQKLVESGDRVSKIEGCPSGTLGYLFGELGRGAAFSTALEGAIAKGYPEPDPREDLSGMDVARKALILGRLLGFPGELEDIAVESLVPDGAGRLKLDQFLASLEQFDAAWAKRVAAARARGGVLRYRAIVTRKSIRVGLVVVDASSPMASLNGTDNPFIFTTMRYKKNPLVITGPGAGPAVAVGGRAGPVAQARRPQPHGLVQGPRHDRGRDAGAARRSPRGRMRVHRQYGGGARRLRRTRRATGAGPRAERSSGARQAGAGARVRGPDAAGAGQLRRLPRARRPGERATGGLSPQFGESVPARRPEDHRAGAAATARL